MKRSSSIRLVLIGGLSAGALAGCSDNASNPSLSQGSVYTNNSFVPGAGYYHAPFRAWYPVPYNHFDPATRRYFFGGEWADAPHLSITNISSPSEQTARTTQAQRTDITRGGFGNTSHFLGVHS